MLLNMVTNITNILLDPPGDRLTAGDNVIKTTTFKNLLRGQNFHGGFFKPKWKNYTKEA